MKEFFKALPTAIFIGLLLLSLFLKNHNFAWTNLFALSLTFLCVYSPVMLFIEGIRTGMSSQKRLSLFTKILIWYLAIISVIFITLAIYLMGHN